MLQSKNKHSGLANIGSSSDTTINKYASIACAVNLHKVSDLLEEAWKFLVSIDMSTHMSFRPHHIEIWIHIDQNFSKIQFKFFEISKDLPVSIIKHVFLLSKFALNSKNNQFYKQSILRFNVDLMCC